MAGEYKQYRDQVGNIADGIIRTSDNANIPNNDSNKDWEVYQQWLDDGNTPLPPSE
jgi:hypothetical protein